MYIYTMVLAFLFGRINSTALLAACGSRLIADESGETPPFFSNCENAPPV